MNPPPVSYETREAFAAALRDFINTELPRINPKMKPNPGVVDDTLLFATGIVDSLAILHLIAFIERATGQAIPPEKVVMKHFQSIAAITGSFWGPPPAP